MWHLPIIGILEKPCAHSISFLEFDITHRTWFMILRPVKLISDA